MARRHGEQLSIANDPAYEAEHLTGSTGEAFAVVLQPHSGGAQVSAPPRVTAVTWVYDGEIHVHLKFPERGSSPEHGSSFCGAGHDMRESDGDHRYCGSEDA